MTRQGLRCGPREVARMLGTTERALQNRFASKRRRTGRDVVYEDGIRAEKTPRNKWIVFVSEDWLIDGAVPE